MQETLTGGASSAQALRGADATANANTGIDRAHRRVILASSLGTVFEWYDFYLYGSLATVVGQQFSQA